MIELDPTSEPLNPAEFERQLRATGHSYYIYHPFNVLLRSGNAALQQVRAWVANRFYYECNLPLMDAGILDNCADQHVRREWMLRIVDQEGRGSDPGVIGAWARLGQAVGVPSEELRSMQHVLPAVRLAVDSYVEFARREPWQESVCASLTDLFAPSVADERLTRWELHYPWIEPSGLEYFRSRQSCVPVDRDLGLRITLEHFRTRAQQTRALAILRGKLELLWSALDAVHVHYEGNAP